jgi:hypothetical protein
MDLFMGLFPAESRSYTLLLAFFLELAVELSAVEMGI